MNNELTQQVVYLRSCNYKLSEIAAHLKVPEQTVKNHLYRWNRRPSMIEDIVQKRQRQLIDRFGEEKIEAVRKISNDNDIIDQLKIKKTLNLNGSHLKQIFEAFCGTEGWKQGVYVKTSHMTVYGYSNRYHRRINR